MTERILGTGPALMSTANGGTTRLRREHKTSKVFPVISRSGRAYKQQDGRPYGDVDPAAQRQADAGYWCAGEAVRRDCEPMVVTVAGGDACPTKKVGAYRPETYWVLYLDWCNLTRRPPSKPVTTSHPNLVPNKPPNPSASLVTT